MKRSLLVFAAGAVALAATALISSGVGAAPGADGGCGQGTHQVGHSCVPDRGDECAHGEHVGNPHCAPTPEPTPTPVAPPGPPPTGGGEDYPFLVCYTGERIALDGECSPVVVSAPPVSEPPVGAAPVSGPDVTPVPQGAPALVPQPADAGMGVFDTRPKSLLAAALALAGCVAFTMAVRRMTR